MSTAKTSFRLTSSHYCQEIRRKLLIEEIDQAVVMAHHLQVPGPEFLDLIQVRMDALERKRRAHEDDKENKK